jgi:tetratricopeptide (TPR) repeat protein
MRYGVIIIVLLLTGISATAQSSEDYMTVMVRQKKAFRMAATEKDFHDLAVNFERIASVETNEWHPLYYAAFCYINMSFISKDIAKKDVLLDKAQELIDRSLEIYPEESELFVLQGLIYQGRIQIHPKDRGKIFALKANESLKRAKELNPDNPRAYYLLGLNALHAPKSVGGGADAACSYFNKAADKFEKYIAPHVLSPTWGAEDNDRVLNQNCPASK